MVRRSLERATTEPNSPERPSGVGALVSVCDQSFRQADGPPVRRLFPSLPLESPSFHRQSVQVEMNNTLGEVAQHPE